MPSSTPFWQTSNQQPSYVPAPVMPPPSSGSGRPSYVPAPPPAAGGPPGYTLCAEHEGDTCSFSGRASVAYGANGVFNYGTFDNSVKCSYLVFGDPAVGVFKACYVKKVPQVVVTPVVVTPQPVTRPPPVIETPPIFDPQPGSSTTSDEPLPSGDPLPDEPIAGGYKAGSVTRFNTSRNVWSVYSPLAGFGLGAAGEVVPPVPVGFVKVGEELAPPAGVVNAGQEQDKGSIWTNPYFWLAVAGGVATLGTGSYFLLRRKRKD